MLGANGAGKTSAINVVMRAAFPTAGDALVPTRAFSLSSAASALTMYDGVSSFSIHSWLLRA